VVVVFEGEAARGSGGWGECRGEDEEDFALAFLHVSYSGERGGSEVRHERVIVEGEGQVFEDTLRVGGLFLGGDEAVGVGVDLGEDLWEDGGAGGKADPNRELGFFEEEVGVLEVFVGAVGNGLRRREEEEKDGQARNPNDEI
jgi:hypothetical protein